MLDAKIVMQDQYDRRYGLLTPKSAKHPLVSVLMHPCENTTMHTTLYDLYEEYALKNYQELWGLSVDEFVHRPVWMVEMMREVADEVLKKRAAAVESMGNTKPSK